MNKTIHMKNLKVGDSAEIIRFSSDNAGYRQRLMSMGLTRGTLITLIKRAPLGDPVELHVRGYSLSLRANEADILIMRKV